MEFVSPLIKGKIQKIYQSLIIDVQLENGDVVPVFCPDVEYVKNIYQIGADVWICKNRDERYHLQYELQYVNYAGSLILINQAYIKDMFEEGFMLHQMPDFQQYTKIRKIQFGDELIRAHFELSNNQEKCYVYVVGIYNKVGADIVFPTHINFYELSMFNEFRQAREQGAKTAVVMLVTRSDCNSVRFVWNIEAPASAAVFQEAKNGLNFCCYSCNIDETRVSIAEKIDILY